MIKRSFWLSSSAVLSIWWLLLGLLVYRLGASLMIMYAALCLMFFWKSYSYEVTLAPIERKLGFLEGELSMLKKTEEEQKAKLKKFKEKARKARKKKT